MAKGSIRFNDLINVEVAVDPTQAAGSKLLSAVNLVDGQSLGGGGSDFEIVEVTFVRGTKSGDITITVPFIEHWDYSNIDTTSAVFYLASASNEITKNIILYKGHAYAYANDGNVVLVGDNFDADNEVITGGGTITLNAE